MNNELIWICPVCKWELRQPKVGDDFFTSSTINDIKIDHLAMHINQLANGQTRLRSKK